MTHNRHAGRPPMPYYGGKGNTRGERVEVLWSNRAAQPALFEVASC